jgi:undecaprenyl-diphosphatase
MNGFDSSILSFFNRFVGKHPTFDDAVVYLSNDGFLRAGLIVALCWWVWFKDGEDKTSKNHATREAIISTVLACFASILIARLVVLPLPFRIRPIADPTNGWHFPPATTDWQNWSSFPSDHAVMFFTLTTCLFFISDVMGWIALIDTVVLICLPRIYLGIHYPTDIIAGAVIGVAVGFAANQQAFKHWIAKRPLQWMQEYPGPFYAVFGMLMYEMSVIFSDVRHVGLALIKLLVKLVVGR